MNLETVTCMFMGTEIRTVKSRAEPKTQISALLPYKNHRLWHHVTLNTGFVVSMGNVQPLSKRGGAREPADLWREREAVQPRYGLSSSGSGSSTRPLCCVGTETTKTASGTNENENYSFMWTNSEEGHPVEVRRSLGKIGPTHEDCGICYSTVTPPNGFSCPAAKVS